MLPKMLIYILFCLFTFSCSSASAKRVYSKAVLNDVFEVNSSTSLPANYGSSNSYNSSRTGRVLEAVGDSVYNTASILASSSIDYYFLIKQNDLVYLTRITRSLSRLEIPWIIGDQVEISFNKKKNRVYLKEPSGGKLKLIVEKVQRIKA